MKYLIIVLIFFLGYVVGSGNYRTYNTTTTIFKIKDTTIFKPKPYKIFEKAKNDTVRLYRDTIINYQDTIIIDNSVSNNKLDSISVVWLKSPVINKTVKLDRWIIGPNIGVDYKLRPTFGLSLTYKIISF